MKYVVLTILINYFGIAFGQVESCKFDSTTVDFSCINNINGKYKELDTLKKEAKIITAEGNYLYLKKWACITKGTLARLVVMTEDIDVNNHFVLWKERILKLGEQLLEKTDYKIFSLYFMNPDLTAERYGKDLVFNIKQEKYQKFVLVISPQDNMVTVSLLYYEE